MTSETQSTPGDTRSTTRLPPTLQVSELLLLPNAGMGDGPMKFTEQEAKSVMGQATPRAVELLIKEQEANLRKPRHFRLAIPSNKLGSVYVQHNSSDDTRNPVPTILSLARHTGEPIDWKRKALTDGHASELAAYDGRRNDSQLGKSETYQGLHLELGSAVTSSERKTDFTNLIRDIQAWPRDAPLIQQGTVRWAASTVSTAVREIDHLINSSATSTNLPPGQRLYAVDVDGNEIARLGAVERLADIDDVSRAEGERTTAGGSDMATSERAAEKVSVVVITDNREFADICKVSDGPAGQKIFGDFSLGPVAGILGRAAAAHPESVFVYSIADTVRHHEDQKEGLVEEHLHFLTARDLEQLQSEIGSAKVIVTTDSRLFGPFNTYLQDGSTPSEFGAATESANARYTPPEDVVRYHRDPPRPSSSRGRGGHFNRRGGGIGTGPGRDARDAGNNSDGTADECTVASEDEGATSDNQSQA